MEETTVFLEIGPTVLSNTLPANSAHPWRVMPERCRSGAGKLLFWLDHPQRVLAKVAILIGMIPKEYQDLILQNGTLLADGDLKFTTIRDYVINVASQKLHMVRPVIRHEVY